MGHGLATLLDSFGLLTLRDIRLGRKPNSHGEKVIFHGCTMDTHFGMLLLHGWLSATSAASSGALSPSRLFRFNSEIDFNSVH